MICKDVTLLLIAKLSGKDYVITKTSVLSHRKMRGASRAFNCVIEHWSMLFNWLKTGPQIINIESLSVCRKNTLDVSNTKYSCTAMFSE